jgi:hypothetical protein
VDHRDDKVAAVTANNQACSVRVNDRLNLVPAGTPSPRVDGFLHNVCHEDRVPGILGFVADVISTTLEVINENAPLDRRMAYLRPAALEVIRPESPAGTQRCTVQLRMSHLC